MKKWMSMLALLFAMLVCVPAQAATHGEHYVCGQTVCTHAGTAHSGSMHQWAAWDGGEIPAGGSVYYCLKQNVKVEKPIEIPAGTHVYLCLNGYDLTQTAWGENTFTVNSTATKPSSLTICDCTAAPGVVSTSNAKYNSNVSLKEKGTFNLYNGTLAGSERGVYTQGNAAVVNLYGGKISKNEKYGVYLYAAESELNMYGGNIHYTYNGPGVLIHGVNAKMTMTGGTITQNVTGVRMTGFNAALDIAGGEIVKNINSYSDHDAAYTGKGGGVYLSSGTLHLDGGLIANNSADNGGGIYADGGRVWQNGGVIKENTCSRSSSQGGGVYVGEASYYLKAGSIIDNVSWGSGGGMYCIDGQRLSISGGEITGNNARHSGGGLYLAEHNLSISGDVKIIGNSIGGWYNGGSEIQQYVSNIHLADPKSYVSLDSAVKNGEFGVTCADVTSYPHEFVKVFSSNNHMDENRLAMFKADDPSLVPALNTASSIAGVLTKREEHTHKICGVASEDDCTHMQDEHADSMTWRAWDGVYKPLLSEGSTCLYLTQDVTSWAQLQVNDGQTLYLCLNGHQLTQYEKNVMSALISAGGAFVLCDCAAPADQGVISSMEEGGIRIWNNGTFTMYGGKLTGGGNAVYCTEKTSAVNLYGGQIYGNGKEVAQGCGIYMQYGILNMYGGVIRDNGSERDHGKGGGVYLGDGYEANSATMNMYGGTITGNKMVGVGSAGGGIYVAPCGRLNLYGGTITQNAAVRGGGVKLDKNQFGEAQLHVKGNVTITGNTAGNLDILSPFIRDGEMTGAIGLSLQGAPTETTPASFASNCAGMTEAELARYTSDQGYQNKRVYNGYAQFYVPQEKYTLTATASEPEGGVIDGVGSYETGAKATLSAVANTGYRFTGWEVISGSLTLTDEQKKAETISFTMPAEALSVRANFTRVTVTIKAETTQHIYSGVIRAAGREDAQSQELTVAYGTEVTLTAIPDAGYHVNGWQVANGSMVENDAAYTFVAMEDIALKVYIAPNEYDFVIRVSPENSGTAKSVELDATQGQYKYGFGGTLKAEANEGYTFLRWEVKKGEGTFDDPAAAETYFSIGLGDVEITAIFVNAHSHAICGETVTGADCAMPNHDGHAENVVFLPWDGSTELYFESGEHYIYITDDVETDQEIYVRGDATLYLCLNGKSLTSGATNAIDVGTDAKFVLCDCVGTSEDTWGKITRKTNTLGRGIENNGKLEIYGGHITGHDTRGLPGNSRDGGGINSWPTSSITLYNGSISNNKAGFEGGGVYIWKGSPSGDGDFVMYGGRIHDNYAADDGGGVCVHGAHFIVNGGRIDHNTTDNNGGGIYNGGRVTINDGGVSENEAARSGGGMFSLSMTGGSPHYIVTMNGGYVARNVAAVSAGGMNTGDGLFLSGAAGVARNKVGSGNNLKESNICLSKGAMIIVDGTLSASYGGSPEAIGITLAQEPINGPVAYMKRVDGPVTENDIAHTYSDAVFNDATMAEFYNKRINADGIGEFYPNLYQLTLVNAKLSDDSISGSFAKGVTVTAQVAAPAGQVFIEWIADGMTLTDEQKQTETLAFTMPANAVTLTARCASAVARVDDVEYTDFNEALSAWHDGATLTLLADVSTSGNVELRADDAASKTLDLNGNTWTGTSGEMLQVYSNVTLTIKDSAAGGGLKNTDASAGVVTVYNDGNLQFTNGQMKAATGITGRLTTGMISISGGTIDATGTCVISNGAVMISGVPMLSGQRVVQLAGSGRITIQPATSIPDAGWLVYNDGISAGVAQGSNLSLPDGYCLLDAQGKLVELLENGHSAYIKTHVHTAGYIADETRDTITHGCSCGINDGSVKLVIPSGTLVEDGTPKAAAVEGDLTGYTLTYQQDGKAIDGEPTKVGTYQAILALGGVSVSAEYTIQPDISEVDVYSVYSVTHYLEQLDGTYAEVEADTQFPLQGRVGAEVKAVPRSYTGYRYNGEQSTASARLVQAAPGADGKPVYTRLELYYDLNSYTLTFMSDGAEYAKLTQKYGSRITAPAAPAKAGWVFIGWDQAIPATMPAENLTLTARWRAFVPVVTPITTPVPTPTATPIANPLMIVKHPTDQIVASGETAVFTAEAMGDGVSYQWYIHRNDDRGWVKLQGATNSEFRMPAVARAFDGFQYVCEVRDVHGNVLSTNVAVLYVVAQPDIPQTGDHTSVMVLCALVLFSGAGCYVLLKKRQRYHP